jgi:hypothetical protein
MSDRPKRKRRSPTQLYTPDPDTKFSDDFAASSNGNESTDSDVIQDHEEEDAMDLDESGNEYDYTDGFLVKDDEDYDDSDYSSDSDEEDFTTESDNEEEEDELSDLLDDDDESISDLEETPTGVHAEAITPMPLPDDNKENEPQNQ